MRYAVDGWEIIPYQLLFTFIFTFNCTFIHKYIYKYMIWIFIHIYIYTIILYSPCIQYRQYPQSDILVWIYLFGVCWGYWMGLDYFILEELNTLGILMESNETLVGCFGFCKLHLSRPQHFAFGDMVGLGMAIAEPVQCQAPSKFDPSLCGHLEEHMEHTHICIKKSTPCWADAACSACLWHCCSSRFLIFADGIRWGAQ